MCILSKTAARSPLSNRGCAVPPDGACQGNDPVGVAPTSIDGHSSRVLSRIVGLPQVRRVAYLRLLSGDGFTVFTRILCTIKFEQLEEKSSSARSVMTLWSFRYDAAVY